MALTETQQVFETIRHSARPLICVPSGAGADGYASALGLASVLKKLGKEAAIVAADGKTPKSLSFLNGQEHVQASLDDLRRFVLELDVSKSKVKELSYEVKDNKLRIHLRPVSGTWNPKDLTVQDTGYRYDLIICLGAPDLEACGELYRAQPDFFFATPIINIDHAPENERFGQLNVVDLTAAAIGEVCHDLVEAMDASLIDEEAATAFLTGLIAKTRSFKQPNLSPKTLQTAAKLVARGARREEAVQHLFRTRSVPTLRLWGRALARLKQDAEVPFVWSILSRQDFLHAGAEEADLSDVIDELITSSPAARIVGLIYEASDRTVRAVLHAERPFDALLLAHSFKPTGNRARVQLKLDEQNLVKAEQKLIEEIRGKAKAHA